MPTFNNDLDIDINDFIYACDSSDIEELIEELKYHGYLTSTAGTSIENSIDEQWVEAMNKLSISRMQLTKEEEELIYKIVSKL
jgi:hypothetical protein